MVSKLRVALPGLILAAVAFISPLSAHAATRSWSVDTNTSAARLFQGSTAKPQSFNTGVARVSGQVKLDPDDLNNFVLDLAIYPAEEDWSGLDRDGTLPAGFVPDATDQTLLVFHTERVLAPGNGRLDVIGNLTLTTVERSITIDPTQGYAGPVLGPPVIHVTTRQVAFELPDYGAAATQPDGKISVSASTEIAYEDFPELFTAVSKTNWPPVVANENCQMPSTIGEDYRGPQCTGTVIAATDENNCQMPPTMGEDYSGPVCTPPTGDRTTIALQLELTAAGSQSADNIVLSAVAAH